MILAAAAVPERLEIFSPILRFPGSPILGLLSSQTPAMSAFPTLMAYDLARGKRLEYDALNGAVVRFGERLAVSVPLNRTLYSLLARLDPQPGRDHQRVRRS